MPDLFDVAFNATGSTVYVLESSRSNIDTISTSTAPNVLNVDKYPAVTVFGSSIAVKGSNLYVTDAEEQSLTVVPTGGGAYTHIAVGPNPGQSWRTCKVVRLCHQLFGQLRVGRENDHQCRNSDGFLWDRIRFTSR